MARLCIPILLCFALLTPAATPAERAGSTTVSGVYRITFNLNVASTLPAGTTITCRARIVPNPGEIDRANATPAETAAGLATVTGSAATCAAEIPFSWTLQGAQNGIVLSYEIDAVSGAGLAPLLVRSSARQGIGAAFPAVGEMASLSFNVAL